MKEESYKNIFKTTFLFGFVQVFNILVKVISNKIVAILLGAEGMGIISIYNNTIDLIKSGAGLGISQSAVRDISEANANDDKKRFSTTISVTNKVIIFTGLLGAFITLILSPWLSLWTMGSKNYTFVFMFLAIVVGAKILTDGQLAILMGMRKLKSLARASMLGAIIGLIVGVPMYYMLGLRGIAPSLVICALAALFFSNFFVRKIHYERITLSMKEMLKNASPMIKMGMALVFASFLSSIVTLVISAYMRAHGGLEDVGFYNAGIMILNGYFGVIITALTTDYYPRIAAINSDNILLQKELNKQAAVSLVLCCPLVVFFLFLLPFFIGILYSEEFFPTIEFIRVAIWGTLITICSNQVDMILVAKFRMQLFTIIAIVFRLLQLGFSLILYQFYGLLGMGISMTVMGIIHMSIMTISVYQLYGIHFNWLFVKLAFIVFGLATIATFVCMFDDLILKYLIGSGLITCACFFSFFVTKKCFGLNVFQYVYNKLKIG